MVSLLLGSTGAISIARDPVKDELTKGVDVSFLGTAVQDQILALQVCAFRVTVGEFLHEGPDQSAAWVFSLQTQCC
jgi:hypothetical protein